MSASDYERRLKATEALLSEDASDSDAAKQLAERYGVTRRTARGWVRKVRKRIAEREKKRKRRGYKRAAREREKEKRPEALTKREALPARHGSVGSPSPDDFKALGAPPLKDPLAGARYMHRGLLLSYWHVMCDDTLPPDKKRKEMREIANAAKGCMPYERLYEVEKLIKEDRAELTSEGGPEMEVAPPEQSRPGRTASKRGRPPRRKV